MDLHFLHEFSHAAESHGVYAEDFVDRLCSKYTFIGLLALAGVSVMRQYVFKPIQCWVPAEWPRPWEEFAENYCWTQNTYRIAMLVPGHPEARERGELTIGYYQWVPILLLAQAVLSMLPHQLWLLISRRLSGLDPHAVLRFAREVEHAGCQASGKRLLTYAAWHLAWGARFRGVSYDETNKFNELGKPAIKKNGCSDALRQSGCVLFILYMLSKMVYAGAAVGQVFLLQSYLGFASPLFGWHCASNLLRGGSWELTGVFPRLTFCDLPTRHVGQFNLRSVQCVLASNMIYEKIFIFLWFWFAFCTLASLASAASWLAQLLPPTDRTRLVRRYLSLQSMHHQHDNGHGERDDVYKAANRLTDQLGLDGVMLLQLIADNVDCLCAAQLLNRLREQRDEAFTMKDNYESQETDHTQPPDCNSEECIDGDSQLEQELKHELKVSSV